MRAMTEVARADARTLATAALVLEITTAAAGERDLDAILRAVLDRLRGVVSFTGGSIALVDGDELVIRAAIGPFEAEALGQRLRRGAGKSWAVIETLRPVRIDDLAREGAHAAGAEASAAMRSWLAVPIERHGVGIGLLEVDSVEPRAFYPEDERLVATVGRALAGPIDLAVRSMAEERARELRDAFVGIVSHELRTPITTIYGMSQLLRHRYRSMDPETLGQAIDDIEAEADRLRRLAEDLLVLSRAESGRLTIVTEPLVLAHIVRRVAESEAPRAPAHRIVVAVPPGLPIVDGEDLYIGQVLHNLVGNAAKYSPEGTTIEITGAVEDGGVSIRVLDQGPGPSSPPERLFELYYRSPDAEKESAGAGIGLFVCRELIEAMNGRIWALPRPTGGAEFGFWLPLHVEGHVDSADD